MVPYYHRWILSYLHNMPSTCPFFMRDLQVHISNGMIKKLHILNYIRVVDRSVRSNRWMVTDEGRELLKKYPAYTYNGDLPRYIAPFTKRDTPRYIAEVRNYLKSNPDAKVFDVALELHFGDNHAARLMKILSEERQALRANDSHQRIVK